MAQTAPKLIFGSAGIAAFDGQTINEILALLEKHNVEKIDTANAYASSELTLGNHDAGKKFTIDTKAPAVPGGLSKESILAGMKQSLKELDVSSVDTYYLHMPDQSTPIEESLSGIQELYKEGKFKRFGLSNFRAADVQNIYDIQAANNSVLPSVFQGNYNAVARHIEADLLSLLHKLKISFFAYSPIAGGFLVKNSASLRAKEDEGRFGPNSGAGEMYSSMYMKESLLDALDEWELIAKDAGITKAALAYRWITYHSALKKENGDAVILGATKISQLEETLENIEAGPLDEKTAKRVDDIWNKVEHEAPLDNYNSYVVNLLG